jgi:hypothetical protein
VQGSGLHFLYPAKEEGQEEEERRRRRKVRRRRRRSRNLLSYKRHTIININGILFRMSMECLATLYTAEHSTHARSTHVHTRICART